MATVKEFKKWLEKFPEDTIVQVAIGKDYGDVGFQDIEIEDYDCVEGWDVGDGWEYIDFTDNEFVKKDAYYYGKKYLHLGERK